MQDWQKVYILILFPMTGSAAVAYFILLFAIQTMFLRDAKLVEKLIPLYLISNDMIHPSPGCVLNCFLFYLLRQKYTDSSSSQRLGE